MQTIGQHIALRAGWRYSGWGLGIHYLREHYLRGCLPAQRIAFGQMLHILDRLGEVTQDDMSLGQFLAPVKEIERASSGYRNHRGDDYQFGSRKPAFRETG